MFNSLTPFEQQSSNPFASQSAFPQTSIATANPFAPKPFGSTSPFGSQTGTSIFGGTSTGVFGAPQASSPFSSTTTFGASSSPAFGTTMSAFGASSTPAFGSSSSAFGGSSVFGQKPVFGGFGSTPTQTSPFMSTSQQSQPTFGSSIFGSSSPFGATSQSAFGATSTPTFGSTTTSAFGATSTPAFGVSSTPSFGVTSAPSFGATSSPAFGAPTTPFGSASGLPFNSTGSAFGVSSSPAFGSGGTFGASNTPVFGSPSTSAFGASSAPVFGASSTPAFGASSSPTFGFGSSPAFGQSSSAFGSNTFGSNSTPFGTQSSAFGAQSTTTFGNTTFGQSTFGSQRGGTRIAAYTPTTEPDSGSGSQGAGKLESISAMPVYKDKCHEELRWEDYQLGDKGGPLPAGHSAVGVGFNSSTPSQPNPLTSSATFGQSPTIFGQAPATFGQAPANPFSTPTSSNPFAPKTSAFGTTSNFSFSSSAFAPSTSSNLFGSTISPSTSSFISTTTAPFGSSPSLFNSSSTPTFGTQSTFGSATTAGSTQSFGPSINFGNTQASPLFPASTPSIGQSGSAFGQSTSPFGQNTASFGQSSLGTAPTSVFGNNLFSSTPSLMSSSNPAFGQSSSNFSTPFQPAQTQPVGAFGFGNFGQAQPAGTSGIGGTSSVFGQNGFGQLPASHASVVAQPTPVTNPFGTLPVMPQMSIGRTGNTSSIQYGISSMPVFDKPPPMKISSLLTSRHLSQRRIRLPAKKYYPKKDGAQVPFFSEDEETPGTPKADALFIPRENPRSLVIRPAEQWSTRTSTENSASMKDTFGLHMNGKILNIGKNPEETSISSDFNFRDKNGNSLENGLEKEPNHLHGVNQKTNGFHEETNIQKGDAYMTVNGHRAGEAAIAYEHGADIEALMPKLRLADYYTEPKIQELAAKERAYPGFCRHVKDFVVGRHGFGSIKFFGETDVRRIDLDSLVQFNNREVIVYMDDTKKPPVGQGLNKPAEVTLLNIKCFDKKTGRQYTEGPKVEKYKEMLKRKAEDQSAEFVSYDPVKGEWKFKVNHFSKYSMGDEDVVGEWE